MNSSNVSVINVRCLRLILYLNSVHNVSANLLQQHTIEICCKMIQLLYQ